MIGSSIRLSCALTQFSVLQCLHTHTLLLAIALSDAGSAEAANDPGGVPPAASPSTTADMADTDGKMKIAAILVGVSIISAILGTVVLM
jgi:hypothetical protein